MSAGERGRIPALDGVRGIAIILVLVGHADYRLAPLAAAGVALFFTLSGYLITGLLLAEHDRHGQLNLRRFYARRLTRLAPPLFVMLGTSALLLRTSWRDLLAPLTWTTNYTATAPYLSHTWSLGVEEQFYLVWPIALLGLLRLRRPGRALVVTITVLAAWWLALLLAGQFEYSYKALETAGVPILAGALVALANIRLAPSIFPTGGLVALAGFMSVVDGTDLWGFVPMVCTPITAAIVAAAGGSRWLSWRPLGFCGLASYSMYLWHLPVAWAIHAQITPLGIGVGAAIGLIAYFAVEVPVMRIRRQRQAAPARSSVLAIEQDFSSEGSCRTTDVRRRVF